MRLFDKIRRYQVLVLSMIKTPLSLTFSNDQKVNIDQLSRKKTTTVWEKVVTTRTKEE